jgi:hypothetical protein
VRTPIRAEIEVIRKRGVLAGCTSSISSAMMCSWQKQCLRADCRSPLLVDGGVHRSVA